MQIPAELMYTGAVTTLVGLVVTALWNRLGAFAKAAQEREETRDKRDERLEAKLDLLMDATQTTMRATLIHNAEKYFEREWVTPEERASWCDMHDRYSRLGANGLIETYRRKLDALPDKLIV